MSKLQESLTSSNAVYAGGDGVVEIPQFDEADEFIPDGADSGLIDDDGIPAPAPVEDEPAAEPEAEPEPVPAAAPEPATEPEPDAEPEPEPAAEEPVRNKQDFLHRLNAKNKKLVAKDARILELEAQLAGGAPRPAATATPAAAPAVPQVTIPKLQERRQQILDLTIDGNTAEAARLQGELDGEIYAAAVTAATAQVLQTVKQNQETETLDTVLADIAATYPELDETGDVYDTKSARMINAVMAEYVEDDHSPAEALRLATDEVMRLRYPNYFTAEAAPTAAPVKPAAKPAAVKAVVAKAAAAAGAQPALPPSGANPRTVAAAPLDIFSMSEEEFNKLTPAQLSELRGDNL